MAGVYRRTDGQAVFQGTRAPNRAELEGLLEKIIAHLPKMLTRSGNLVEEQGVSYIADMDADNQLASLQTASCTYRIALGPRAGQKVLSLRSVPGQDEKNHIGTTPPTFVHQGTGAFLRKPENSRRRTKPEKVRRF